MALERTITYQISDSVISKVTSSDGTMVAGYPGKGDVTKLAFILSGEIWSNLVCKCVFSSPTGGVKIHALLDSEKTCLIPSGVLDKTGTLKFSLIGLFLDSDHKICVKTGVSQLTTR